MLFLPTTFDVSSFKGKLVAHFVLLSLVPLVAANFGFWSAERNDAAREADRELRVGLRAASAAYADTVRAAQARATSVARQSTFDRSELARLAQTGGLRIVTATDRFGVTPDRAAQATAKIVQNGRRIGSVTAFVKLDTRLVRALRLRSGLPQDGRIALAYRGKVVAGPGAEARVLATSEPFSVQLASGDYRALAVQVGPPERTAIVALVPAAPLAAAQAASARRLALALIASLLVIALIAYFEARFIVRALRRLADGARAIAAGQLGSRVTVSGKDEVAAFSTAFNEMAEQLERRVGDLHDTEQRLRTSISRFADVLSSTHDRSHLAQAVVSAAVDATGATGGVFTVGNRVIASVGEPHADDVIAFPVRFRRASFGTLTLSLAGVEPGDEAFALAESLAKQAGTAFENARLHTVLARQARVDELTGLANRRHGRELLEREMQRAARLGSAMSIALCDLDHFKQVNDTFGHAAGDAVLRAFADLVRRRVRQIDVACRWGGEEFLLVLPETDVDGALHLAETLRARLESLPITLPDGQTQHVTGSFGVVAFVPGLSAEQLVARADQALYGAKESGRNTVAQASDAAALPS